MRRELKRGHLIDVAAELFNRHGYHATGIDRIMAATGISKATLYRHFKTKDELIVAVLARQDEAAREEMRSYVENASTVPRERLLATFGQLDVWLKACDFFGCPFMAAASEFSEGPNLVLQQVQIHKRLYLAFFEELVRAAQIPEPRTVARQIVMLHEGAVAFAQVFGAEGAAASARHAADVIIDAACSGESRRGSTPSRALTDS